MSVLTRLMSRYKVQGNPLRAERRVELIALLLTLLLLLQLVYSATRLVYPGRPEAIKPALEAVRKGSELRVEVVTEAASQEIRSRPLFWASRRPEAAVVEEPVAEEKAPSTELDKVKLVGIFGAGDSAGIITLVQGKKQRILLGEDLSGWKLDAIEPNRAEFISGALTKTLELTPIHNQGSPKPDRPRPDRSKPGERK